MRHSLVRMLGEKGHLLVYSLVAFATLGAAGHFYGEVQGDAVPLWTPGIGIWLPASILMWIGSILFVGSLRRNPAFPQPGVAAPRMPDKAKGVYAITRHPMMWAFAIWAGVHVAVNPTLPSFMMSAAIGIVALAGAAAQDERKALTIGPEFRDWMARTAFVPFAKGVDYPDRFATYGGTILFLGVTFAHRWFDAMPAGFWRWIG
nr:NnrU family protein [Sphingomicrobium nitratireducens]